MQFLPFRSNCVILWLRWSLALCFNTFTAETGDLKLPGISESCFVRLIVLSSQIFYVFETTSIAP